MEFIHILTFLSVSKYLHSLFLYKQACMHAVQAYNHQLTLLHLAMVVSYAAVAPETYWKSVLPNTPMPKAVTDLLNNDFIFFL
ncbi:hypothetical protein R6Q57_016659 [Mikania cordata]